MATSTQQRPCTADIFRTAVFGVLLTLGIHGIAAEVTAAASQPAEPLTDDVVIQASVWQVHGDTWSLHITRSGTAYFDYMASHRGNVSGTFFVDQLAIARLLDSGALKDFATLPPSQSPRLMPMHMPEYDILIHTNNTRHRARLSYPEGMQSNPDIARFWAAWNAIWAQVPLRPPPPREPSPDAPVASPSS